MRDFLKRVGFWLRVKTRSTPQWVRPASGHTLAARSYNIQTDQVEIYEGRFQAVDFGPPYRTISREHFLTLGQLGWVLSR